MFIFVLNQHENNKESILFQNCFDLKFGIDNRCWTFLNLQGACFSKFLNLWYEIPKNKY